MIFALVSKFHVYLPWVTSHLAFCFNIFLDVKALSTMRKCENSYFAKVCFQLYWCLHIKHIGARVATRSCRCLRTQTRVKITAALRMMYYRVFRVMDGRVNGCTRGTRSRARYQNVTAASVQCYGQDVALHSWRRLH